MGRRLLQAAQEARVRREGKGSRRKTISQCGGLRAYAMRASIGHYDPPLQVKMEVKDGKVVINQRILRAMKVIKVRLLADVEKGTLRYGDDGAQKDAR